MAEELAPALGSAQVLGQLITTRLAELLVLGLVGRFDLRERSRSHRPLGIFVKTADRHVQMAYRKIGVSTRAAATLFAMERGLVASGELSMTQPGARS